MNVNVLSVDSKMLLSRMFGALKQQEHTTPSLNDSVHSVFPVKETSGLNVLVINCLLYLKRIERLGKF